MKDVKDKRQAVINGVIFLNREAANTFVTLGAVADHHLATARFLNNERAVAYWQAVVNFCRSNGIK